MRAVAVIVRRAGALTDDRHLDHLRGEEGLLQVGMGIHTRVDKGDTHAGAGQAEIPVSQVRLDRRVGLVQVGLHGRVERDVGDLREGREVFELRRGQAGGVASDRRVPRLEETPAATQPGEMSIARIAGRLHDHRDQLISARSPQMSLELRGQFEDALRLGALRRC